MVHLGDIVLYHTPLFPHSHRPIPAMVSAITGRTVTLHCFYPDSPKPRLLLSVPHRLDKNKKANQAFWDYRVPAAKSGSPKNGVPTRKGSP